MRNLITLVKMQLKEKLNFKAVKNEKIDVFKLLVSVLFAVLKFAVITAVYPY